MASGTIVDVITTMSSATTLNVAERNKLYENVKSIIDHTDWYDQEKIKQVKDIAMKSYLFTTKQKKSFNKTSIHQSIDGNYGEYEDGCPDCFTHEEWDECMERQD